MYYQIFCYKFRYYSADCDHEFMENTENLYFCFLVRFDLTKLILGVLRLFLSNSRNIISEQQTRVLVSCTNFIIFAIIYSLDNYRYLESKVYFSWI